METESPQEMQTRVITKQEQNRPARLVFSNPQQRSAHIQAFREWLPKVLHEVPGIQWEELPSQVMGYLMRNVTDHPDVIAITLASGIAMDTQKTKVLYSVCCGLTQLFKRLRSQYGMETLDDLSKRAIWDRFVEGRTLPS